MDQEYLKRLGLSIARGVPQMATGFVDLAALPFTMTGLLDDKDVVGSTAYLTEMGLLPPPQEGVLNETAELVSGAMSPGGALKGGLLGLGVLANASKSTIRSAANDLAKQLNDLGFQANVFHSGSKAGPSSYVEIYDPQTGRFFNKPIRFSDHGKGPKESRGVTDVTDINIDSQKAIEDALEMRNMGKSNQFLIEEKAQELIKQGIKPKQAYNQARALFN
jgi:hypothetical protein